MLFLGSCYAWLYLLWVQLNFLILITHSKSAVKSISNYLVINGRGGKHKSLELVTGWPYFVHVGLWDTSFWWAEIQWILSLIFSFIVWQLCKTHVLCNAAAGGTTESHKSTCYSSPIERLFCLRRGLGRAVPFCKKNVGCESSLERKLLGRSQRKFLSNIFLFVNAQIPNINREINK